MVKPVVVKPELLESPQLRKLARALILLAKQEEAERTKQVTNRKKAS